MAILLHNLYTNGNKLYDIFFFCLFDFAVDEAAVKI